MKLLEKLHLQHPKKEGKPLSDGPEGPDEVSTTTATTSNNTSIIPPSHLPASTSTAVVKDAVATSSSKKPTAAESDPPSSVALEASAQPSNTATGTPLKPSPSLVKITRRRRRLVSRLKPSWRQAINRSVSANAEIAFHGREGKLVVGPLRTWKAVLQRGNYEVPELPADSVIQHMKENLHYFEANYVSFGLVLLAEMSLSCPPLVILAFVEVCLFLLFDSLVRAAPSAAYSPFLRSHGFKIMGALGLILLVRYSLWIKLMGNTLVWITVITVHATLRKGSVTHHLRASTPVNAALQPSVASDVIDWVFSYLPIDLPEKPEGGKDVAVVQETSTVAVPSDSVKEVPSKDATTTTPSVVVGGTNDTPIAAAGG